jgi:hypothetical protein
MLAITAIATTVLALSACAGPIAATEGDLLGIPAFGPFRFSADSAPDPITLPAPTKAEPIVREPTADEPLVLPMVAPASVPATDRLATEPRGAPDLRSSY